jgi:hypothetical protein
MFKMLASFFGGNSNSSPTLQTTAAIDPNRALTSGPTVAFVNQSTIATDAQISVIVPALQIQVDRDFSPIWKLDANLVFVPTGQVAPTGSWIIYIMDTSDQADDLGYHDLETGLPLAKVFAKSDLAAGSSLSVTLSHELLEMLVDPYIQNCVFDQASDTTGTLYSYEICDPCEDDQFGYTINGILVSDFLYPAWFEGQWKAGSTKFDFRGILNSPFSLAEGGYMSTFIVPNVGGWKDKSADDKPSRRLLSKGPGSRHYIRMNKGS